MVAAVLLIVVAAVFAVRYLESGSDSGEVTLGALEEYASGSVTRDAAHGLYVVRLADGSVLALSDLDAANRARSDRRCRVEPISETDPGLPALLDRLRAAFSPPAVGSTLIFREECEGHMYDFAGVRLDADGPNLDRLAVVFDGEGRVVANTAKRTCTARAGAALLSPTRCP